MLEFKLVDDEDSVQKALEGRVPPGTEILYQETIDKTWDKYDQDGSDHQKIIDKTWTYYDQQGSDHQKIIDKTWTYYDEQGGKHQKNIDAAWDKYDQQGAAHQKEIDKALESWWYGDLMSDQSKEVMAVKNGQDPFAK